MDTKKLNNTYFLMRHGHSRANEEGIIISNPSIGTIQYGLTEQGKKQVSSASGKFLETENIIIYCSDFLRGRETAEILQKSLKVQDINFTPLLRERYFGFYDGLDDNQYQLVWEKDKLNENNKHNSVESPRLVSNRVESLISDLENKHAKMNIILISHGDCLQILQTVFDNISPANHRSLNHLQVAEIRKM